MYSEIYNTENNQRFGHCSNDCRPTGCPTIYPKQPNNQSPFFSLLNCPTLTWFGRIFGKELKGPAIRFRRFRGFQPYTTHIGSMMYVDFYGKFVGEYTKLHRSPEDCCVSIRRVAMWSHPPDQNNCSRRSWPFQVRTKEKMIFTVTWRVNHGIPRSLRENKKSKRES